MKAGGAARRKKVSSSMFRSRLGPERNGYILPFLLFVAVALLVGAAAAVAMSTAGILSASSQQQSKQSRDAAEAGIDVTLNTLNSRFNRKLLVAKVPLNSWSSSDPRLRNPCQGGSGPTAEAVALANNVEHPIGGNARQVFVLKSLVLRNPGRTASFSSAADASGPGGISGQESGSYSDTAINADPDAAAAAGGYIEMVVEGRIYDAAGKLKSSSRITREFEVIPKCCGIGFSGPYGNETRACNLPSLILGLSGGGLSYSGSPSPSPTLRLTNGLLDPTASSSKPSTVFCLTAASSCNGNQSSLDGIPLSVLGMTAPAPPVYPACPGSSCSTGYVINSTSTSASDYLRVNSTGQQVEICNAGLNSNTSANSTEPLGPSSVASCTSAINPFCLRETDATSGLPIFHCRISQLTVLDDVASGFNASLSTRRQNNTLWIDSTRGSIYLYMNQAWLSNWSVTGSPVNLTYGSAPYRDGQIQHVSCLDSAGLVLSSYSGVCTQAAKPRDMTRAMLYSDSAINIGVGDDGFLRDMLVFVPKGTLTLSHPTTAGCLPPSPSMRGMFWLNSLTLTRGVTCNLSGYTSTANGMQIVVPPYDNGFANVASQSQIIYEWVARNSTFTSLF